MEKPNRPSYYGDCPAHIELNIGVRWLCHGALIMVSRLGLGVALLVVRHLCCVVPMIFVVICREYFISHDAGGGGGDGYNVFEQKCRILTLVEEIVAKKLACTSRVCSWPMIIQRLFYFFRTAVIARRRIRAETMPTRQVWLLNHRKVQHHSGSSLNTSHRCPHLDSPSSCNSSKLKVFRK